MPWIYFFRDPTARLERIEHDQRLIQRALDGHTETFARLEKKMSALSDAIASLTAAEQAEHEELVLVLAAVKDGQAKLQTAIDQLAASGFTAEDVAAVQKAKDLADANLKAMADALAAPPPPALAEPLV